MSADAERDRVVAWGGISAMCECPLHTLFPQRIADLVDPTLDDLEAACAMIGKDTYGKPHWTPETISPCNPVVQAFARHARLALSRNAHRAP